MSKKKATRVINGIRYYSDRPNDCRKCYFWKNKVVGCMLGYENCYYLAEPIQTPQETRCSGCCYAKNGPCVSASCYQDLDKWLYSIRAAKALAGEDLYDE